MDYERLEFCLIYHNTSLSIGRVKTGEFSLALKSSFFNGKNSG